MTSGRLIKLDNLKPRMKVSYDQYYSREPSFIASNNILALSKDFAKYSTSIADYTLDYIFYFLQTSADSF